MKLSKISFAAALVCVAASSQAAMVAGSAQQIQLDDANNHGRVIYISGASAIQKGFDSIVAGLFTPGTTNFYASGSNSTNGTKADYVAVVGQLATTIGSWTAGQNVIIQYRTLGGSGMGVFPLVRNTTAANTPAGQTTGITFANVSTATCTPATGTNALTNPHVCTGTVTQVPDAGVADVDPSYGAFDSAYNTPGETAQANLTTTEIGLLGTPKHLYGLAFGVAVTNNVPVSVNFNKSLYSAILAGNVGTWDQVDPSLAADDIVICRRTPGSGTQVIANQAFGSYPCTTAHPNSAPADRASNPYWVLNADGTQTINVGANTGAAIVIENDTSGDLKNCLAATQGGTTGTNFSFTTHDRDGVKAVTVNFGSARKAIGLLSLDSLNGGPSTTGAWSFRSLGGAGQITQSGNNTPSVTPGSTGVLPTFTDIIAGNYDLISQETMLIPTRTTGEKATVLGQIATYAQSATILAGVPALQFVAGVFPSASLVGTAPAGNTLRTSLVGGDFCSPLQRNN